MKEYKLKSGLIFRVVEDQHPINPRTEWDNIGILACFHTRYNFTDKSISFKREDFDTWEKMKEYIVNTLQSVCCLPVYLYDHSGLTVKTTPFSDQWDSGQIGFIYTTKERLLQHGIIKSESDMNEELKENIPNYLNGEVETWDNFLKGEVWGYQLIKKEKCNLGHEHEEVLDSCWGFYGDINESGIFENIPKGDELLKEEK